MLQTISRAILALIGWKAAAPSERPTKFLVIGAPHTSNWDFPLTLLALPACGVRFSWVAKHTLFWGPVGWFFKKIGGIPVDRSVRGGFLGAMVKALKTSDDLVLAIAPEGTRSRKDHWKGGFYHIAAKAGVSVCLGYIDYPSRTVGLGPFIKPSGNVIEDFKTIEEFYRTKTGKYPEQQSDIRLREKEIALIERELAG